MRICLFHIILIFCYLISYAEIEVKGRVIDAETKEGLAGASVIIKGIDGKIKKFSSSKVDGDFSITVTSVEGWQGVNLEKATDIFNEFKKTVNSPILLNHSNFFMKISAIYLMKMRIPGSNKIGTIGFMERLRSMILKLS